MRMDRHFSPPLQRAIEDGLVAAALVDRNGNAVGLAGAITEEEAMPLAALVMYRLKSDDLAARLFAGEIISITLEDRHVAVGVAKRQLFVVAVLAVSTPTVLDVVRDLRNRVAGMLHETSGEHEIPPPWSGGGGGSGHGPAELPLIELGITVRRERGKA
jgi:hypothetical protein